MLFLADKIIRYSFYALFFLVPLFFYSGNSELFEYNKMMLTYGFTIIIAGAWVVKLILNSQFSILNWFKSIKRTPFDIPILLYLASHILSTTFSIDPHTSVWGYYSRFHEGLLATISYIILYYALVSNLSKKDVLGILKWSFISALIVSIYGILEHFGHSLSCPLVPIEQSLDHPEISIPLGDAIGNIGKNFNDSCWVQDVQNRVFATLGQPNWMGAYLDVVILASLGFILNLKFKIQNSKLIILPALFFMALLFTKSRSSLLGLGIGLGIFISFILLSSLRGGTTKQSVGDRLLHFVRNDTGKCLLVVLTLLACLLLFFGLPNSPIENYSLEKFLTRKPVAQTLLKQPQKYDSPDIVISESADIRRVVWTGAFKVWQRYPLFGSGVETFAYAYYKDRPIEHNKLSEWEFLYNKAHNEFLNILATTGTVGMLAYLSLIAAFVLWLVKVIVIASEAKQSVTNDEKQIASSLEAPRNDTRAYLVVGLFAAYVSILVTNFFGFSVVIIGLYFFLIPGFCLLLSEQPSSEEIKQPNIRGMKPSSSRLAFICLIGLIGLIMEWGLVQKWLADKDYGFGKNLDSLPDYVRAHAYLQNAVDRDGNEPVFKDELALNSAILAVAASGQGSSSAELTRALTQKAIKYSTEAIAQSPNNINFYKTRTKVYYHLSTIDFNYLVTSLQALIKAVDLSPTDPKLQYNLGILLAKVGKPLDAQAVLENAVALKPDYQDTHYALGLVYDQLGQKGKARQQMEYMLTHIGNDDRAEKWLKENTNTGQISTPSSTIK